MKYHCPSCKKMIVKDIERYLKKYPDENWMACPYCGFHFLTKGILGELKGGKK